MHDVPTTYRPTSQAFSNGFSIGESTNKRTIMFKVHPRLSCPRAGRRVSLAT